MCVYMCVCVCVCVTVFFCWASKNTFARVNYSDLAGIVRQSSPNQLISGERALVDFVAAVG